MHAGIKMPVTTQHDTLYSQFYILSANPCTYVSWEMDKCDGHQQKESD